MSSPPAHYAGPSPNAEIRSQAIAKLKRAASLPRTPDGRRQAEPKNGMAAAPAVTAPSAAPTVAVVADIPGGADDSTPSPTRLLNDYGDEELLSPSPGSNFPVGVTMQRSASASSSYHIPTPPYTYGSATASPFYTAQPSPVNPGTDWAAYQLAQSYLPSISPAAPPSSFPAHLTTPTGAGRNTPSPLPSLGDLRNLSRSNSAAARAKAMDKLTGGKSSITPTRSTNVGTPLSSDEDVTLAEPGPARSLFRSGTIGVPRMFGLPNDQPKPTTVDDAVVPSAPIPDTAFDVPRPRLQRSFTVSSSNMGEERRSAVGRRMVERLAERRQARQKEEAEVRNLWVERRRTRGLSTKIVDNTYDWDSNGSPGPELATPPPEMPAAPTPPRQLGHELLAVPDRTPSRSTERSDGEAFEYESHLRRSLSSRTARDNIMEPSPEVTLPSPVPEDGSELSHTGAFARQQQQSGLLSTPDNAQLHPPAPPFATQTRHQTHESTSSGSTVMARESVLSDATSTGSNLHSRNPSHGAVPQDPFGGPSHQWQENGSSEHGPTERLRGGLPPSVHD